MHSMTLETGYLSSRQVIDQSNGCQASGFATGRAARQISEIGVRRQGHTGMGLKILSRTSGPGPEGEKSPVICLLQDQAPTLDFANQNPM